VRPVWRRTGLIWENRTTAAAAATARRKMADDAVVPLEDGILTAVVADVVA